MGSRPSTPDRTVKARGSRSRTGYPNEGNQSSNDVVGPVEPILVHREFLERREVSGSDASFPSWGAVEARSMRSLEAAICRDRGGGGREVIKISGRRVEKHGGGSEEKFVGEFVRPSKACGGGNVLLAG